MTEQENVNVNVEVASGAEVTSGAGSDGFDFSKIGTAQGANIGASFELRHPTERVPIGAFLTVLGKDGDVYRRVDRQQTNRRLAEAARNRDLTLKAEEIEADRLDLIVACTTGWKGVLKKGEPIPFNAENVRKFYKDYPWAAEQAERAMNDRSLFIGG